jgi:hypothetical protein
MVTELTEKIKSSLKDAAKKLTGFKKRAFMAQVTIDYFNSSPRWAETELGGAKNAVISLFLARVGSSGDRLVASIPAVTSIGFT